MTETKQRMPAAERRELVLGEAMAAFAVHGYAGTSTEEVARRAGISQPYLFRLFPTKKALFLALVERCFRRVRDEFAAAAGELTGEEAHDGDGGRVRGAARRPDPAAAADAGVRGLRGPGDP